MVDVTLSHIDGVDARAAYDCARACFMLCLEGARPIEPSLLCFVDEISELVIGRGSKRILGVLQGGVSHAQRLSVPDAWMSSNHARLRRHDDTFVLEDMGAKNGIFVNGERVEHCQLRPGDLLELGNSFGFFQMLPARVQSGVPPHLPNVLRSLSPELYCGFENLERIALSRVPVILYGESGTGKELLARALHQLSGRRGDFAALNCGALSESLANSELFGHRKGAFTGAVDSNLGLVRAAHQGTLFLDEIAELPMTLQVKLLRVLQEQEVLALGDNKPHKVDVRVLAATHQDVLQLVQQGRFRQDLYARLAGFSFTVLPLRQRLEDLGAIISTLIKKLAGEQAGKVTVQRGAARALFAYDWPLNIRELEQVLATSLALSSDNVIMLEHLPERIRTPTGTTAETTLSDEDQELKQRLVALLQQHRGNISAVAREMAKARVQIRRWCKRYAIDVAQYQR